MRINFNPQVQQPNFQAINKHYYDWAVKESKQRHSYGELLRVMRYEVSWGDILPQDAIDTINAIKLLAPSSWQESLDRSINYVKLFLK